MTWRTRLTAIERRRPPTSDNGRVVETLAAMFKATCCGPGSPYERVSDCVLASVFQDRPDLRVAAARLDTIVAEKARKRAARKRRKGSAS